MSAPCVSMYQVCTDFVSQRQAFGRSSFNDRRDFWKSVSTDSCGLSHTRVLVRRWRRVCIAQARCNGYRCPQWLHSWLGKDNALSIVLCSHHRPSLICARALTLLDLQPLFNPAPVYELLCRFSLNTKRAALDDSRLDGLVQRRAQRVCTGAQKISVYDWLGLALLLSHLLH